MSELGKDDFVFQSLYVLRNNWLEIMLLVFVLFFIAIIYSLYQVKYTDAEEKKVSQIITFETGQAMEKREGMKIDELRFR